MTGQPTTVEQYLAALPAERRAILQAVRRVILDNLDKDYEEGIQYRMIGYYVPHRVYPAGYHCDPRQPLPFAALGSQKNYISLHLMCLYGGGDLLKWFEGAWKKAGKKLDMGKCCVRFKKLEDVPLDVIGEVIRRAPAKKYIAVFEALRQGSGRKQARPKAKRAGAGDRRKTGRALPQPKKKTLSRG